MGFIKMSIIDVVDILLVAVIMYYIYKLIRGTNATSILTGILFIYVSWVFAKALNMELMSGILGSVVNVGLLALIVIFQSEIRKFLQSIGDRGQGPVALIKRMLKGGSKPHANITDSIDPIVKACADMSMSKTGALIVIKQDGSLREVIDTGVALDAAIGDLMIRNVFFKNSPLHDGAMVVENNRIVAAKCVLPSTRSEVPMSFGMRHRAALGLSEESDAIVVVVSEETGAISVVHNAKVLAGLSATELKAELIRLNSEVLRKAEEEPTAPAEEPVALAEEPLVESIEEPTEEPATPVVEPAAEESEPTEE